MSDRSENATIFDLHQKVLTDYPDFVRSFILIADERARAFVNQALAEESHLWPEPLVQLSPAYAAGASVDEWAQEGLPSRGMRPAAPLCAPSWMRTTPACTG